MKLRFTPDALTEIDAILAGIADISPSGAANVRNRLDAVLDRLADQPRCGTLTSSPRLRRIVVRPYSYLLFYQIAEDAVVVIALRHAARDPVSMPDAAPRPPPES
ncbi:type II toxin-antitoxin system RelE/ParE family toxin [Methylobacterium sp. J-076]|uniref:type II toxin-antitoxin system RelE/ParE family toxin n=1 Tax=Methylobacterium sp. J-076 TaxID=2836655 RepID=UPI001FB9FC90|nr:type II toxin-antitoxin system RelE/ParE family toxin [Methylobacterium sp. J-076]MCJ2013192.1 type II toxin-antitoxin system RelE/ParE family toxin [Methylobacterium sp. J-076]